MFNWGLKLTDFSELFLLAGHGAIAPYYQVQHPGDAVARTKYILADVKSFLEQSGDALDDIIRIEFTLTKDVQPGEFTAIFKLCGEYFSERAVKPAYLMRIEMGG